VNYYASDKAGNYSPNGAYFYCPQRKLLFQPEGGVIYVSGIDYFEPLP
jgi:hypothetical protein